MSRSTELPLTVSDLEGAPDDGNRYEVIEGELHVSAAPSFFHQRVLFHLTLALGNHLEEHPAGLVAPGVGVIFDQFNGVIPDLVYLSQERKTHILENGRLTAAPEIVVEILSPGSTNEKRDRVVKRELYSTRGVHEYWIVDCEAKSVEVYRKRKEGGLKLAANLRAEDDLTSSVLLEFRLPLAQLFAE
jgi:Uma2 family endonuclease